MLFGGYHNRKSCYLLSLSSQLFTKLPDLHTDRFCHNSVKVKNDIYLVGGQNNNTIEKYEVSSNSLKKVATIETFSFGACLFNDESLLIAGGCDNDNKVTKNCFLFNTSSKQLTHLSCMNNERESHVLVKVGDVIYSIGGWNEKDNYLKSIEEFHPSTVEWQTSSFELQIARNRHQAVAHKHLIYVFGGECNGGETISKIEKINTIAKRVETIPAFLRVSRRNFAIAKVKEKVYILGGYNVLNHSTDSVEIFDLNTEQITQGVKMPFISFGFTSCVL